MINRRSRAAQGSGDCPEDQQSLLPADQPPSSSFIPMGQMLHSSAIDMKTLSKNSGINHFENFVEYSLKPDDTLQNLSVRFACPIASIKRLNNIISDQEFYGLSSIKLPVGKLGVIQETLETLRSNKDNISSDFYEDGRLRNHNSTNNNNIISRFISDDPARKIVESSSKGSSSTVPANDTADHACSVINHNVELPSLEKPRTKDLTNSHSDKDLSSNQAERSNSLDSIYKDLDKSVARAKLAAEFIEQRATDLVQAIAESEDSPANFDINNLDSNPSTRSIQQIEESLTDLGLSVHGLILFIFIICLIGPLAYVIYLEETAQYSKL